MNKVRVTYKELVELGLIPWHHSNSKPGNSWKTTKRKIENESFPHIRDGNKYYFNPKDVDVWFKRRSSQAS